MKETIHYQKKYAKGEVQKYIRLIEKMNKDFICEEATKNSVIYWTMDSTFLIKAHLNISEKNKESEFIAKATIEKTGRYPPNRSEIENILLDENFTLINSV